MRLSAEQVEAIKQETERFFGPVAQVWLFGSHVDDNQRGFTLVELVMTMVIIGILAAVVAPRFFDVNVFQNRGAADQVKAALRYGQKVAVAQHKIVDVSVSTATPSNCGANLDPSGNVICAVQVSVVSKTFRFDALGRPVDTAGVPITAKDSITVGTTIIDIEMETGYVHER